MLISSGLPKSLWGEAVLAAIYIYNRTPHSSLEGFITPYEARYGQKPDISNIKIWGSITYKKELKEMLKKLDNRANLYILVGYGSNQYRLMTPNKRSIITVRDVDILEGYFLKDFSTKMRDRLKGLEKQLLQVDKTPFFVSNIDDEIDKPQKRIDDDISKKWLDSFTEELQQWAVNDDEEFAMITTDPIYNEAMKSTDVDKWKEAIQKEYDCYEPACGQGRGLDAALRGDKKGRKAGRAALPMGGWVT